MIRVNLVPQEILDKELQKQRLAQVSVAAGCLALVFAGISFSHYYKGVQLEARRVEAEAEFKRLEAIVKQVEELEAKARAVKGRLDVIRDLLTARSFYPQFMGRLLEIIGDGVWMKGISVAGASPELVVSLQCQASSSEAATKWLRALQDAVHFKDPVMGALSIDPDGGVTFPMTIKYKPADGAKK
ncbi:MAG: hypothetical protein HY928_08565 [Elusimicrobia bacterium]|nr:hypothetical protein [Elusimicrobiota bacterium]